jgi:AraC family transcriptional activator of pyochelin receptor
LLNEDECLTFTREKPTLRLWMALKQSFYYTLGGLSENVVHERGFNISFTPSLHQTFRLSRQRPYAFVEIHFSPDRLEQLASLFPGVENFLHRIEKQEQVILNPVNQIADRDILTVIEDMVYCAYPSMVRKKYLDYRIMEILILTLRKLTHDPLQKVLAIEGKVVERVYEAGELLTGNLARNYTLQELGLLVGLSIYHLKKGFKAIYGLSVPDFLQEARMQKARLLLEETDHSIAHIAANIGYTHPFAFSSAFKKYFGYTPSLAQKSRRQTVNYN